MHGVVKEREKDESSYLLVTANWHRSAGDGVSPGSARREGGS